MLSTRLISTCNTLSECPTPGNQYPLAVCPHCRMRVPFGQLADSSLGTHTRRPVRPANSEFMADSCSVGVLGPHPGQVMNIWLNPHHEVFPLNVQT